MPATGIKIGAYAAQGMPEVREYNAKSGAAIYAGTVVIWDTGEVDDATANPTAGTVVGVALADTLSAPGYELPNASLVNHVTWREPRVQVVLASGQGTTFVSQLVNNSDVAIAPVAADVGAEYGLRLRTGGSWAVDKNLTSANARVHIVKIDTDQNLVHWKFLPAAIYLA